ncbi:MAG TPA: UvrD-helicase domain-containing protein, partial [Longilinea sp.]|nr:UvrD-helicase domain-containing protein [Longilinea sp.]
MDSIKLTKPQQAILQLPVPSKIFLEGPAGCGKTTVGVQRLLSLLESGIPGDSILVLTPQRTLAEPYNQALHQASLPAGGMVSIQTIGGLAQRTIDLFWPLVASEAGFAHPEQPPHFLTLETAQYYLARLIQPLFEKGYFESVTLDRNRLYSQIIDNLNKAAAVGFAHTTIGERLKSAWAGEPGQLNTFDQVQESANLFRDFCLENNLLDFSLQIELFIQHLWPSFVVRQYLKSHFKHLIVDNVEEDIPVAHDLLAQWLPELESALLIYNTGGGFRIFLGADPATGHELKSTCTEAVSLTQSFVTSPHLAALSIALESGIAKDKQLTIDSDRRDAFSVSNYRFLPEMVDGVSEQIDDLIHQQHVSPGEIVVLAPFISDALRFSLRNALEGRGLPVRTHRPSRSLREEPATLCLLTLSKLAYPDWKLHPSRHDLR